MNSFELKPNEQIRIGDMIKNQLKNHIGKVVNITVDSLNNTIIHYTSNGKIFKESDHNIFKIQFK